MKPTSERVETTRGSYRIPVNDDGAAIDVNPKEQVDFASTHRATLGDLRFRALLGASDWASLPGTVRHRFGKRLRDGATASYIGEVVECRMSRAGRCLAQLLRPLGGPLPTSTDTGVAAIVAVTEDKASDGQFWTRIYARDDGFPHVIQSSKRFRGPTGLEEYVGGGLGMALKVRVTDSALHFDGDHYFMQLGHLRCRLPRLLSPGELVVSHVDRGSGRFDFVLTLTHPWFGELIHQRASFRDVESEVAPAWKSLANLTHGNLKRQD